MISADNLVENACNWRITQFFCEVLTEKSILKPIHPYVNAAFTADFCRRNFFRKILKKVLTRQVICSNITNVVAKKRMRQTLSKKLKKV